MKELSIQDVNEKHQKLKEFLETWPLERVQNLTLEQYTDTGNHNTFCYWLEYETEILGRIGGKPSNKFGIWKRKNNNQIVSEDFRFTNEYAWYKKYGETPEIAFESVKKVIVQIIEFSQTKQFKKINTLDLDSLVRWKIAFLYSDYNLMPIYKKDIIKILGRDFEHPNFKNESLSELHTFIVSKKEDTDDFFVFADRLYNVAKSKQKRNYYVIGTKYGNEKGEDVVDVSEEMYEKGVVSTGFFWHIDFTKLIGFDYTTIYSWMDKNIQDKSGKYDSAKRTLGYFINIKPGDLIALKSHGRFGDLTIIGYAEVLDVPDLYSFDDDELGHTIKVAFLEKNLKINTGLSYGQTIHQIIPNQRKGHFEKIFGSYAIENNNGEDTFVEENFVDNSIDEDQVDEDRINEKATDDYLRSGTSSQIVKRTHNKIQNEFAIKLKQKYPKDSVRTEDKFIDVKRENDTEIHLYEIKPYTSVFNCIRSGIGQLIDYSFKNSKKNKTTKIYIVGNAKPNELDNNFIDYLNQKINIEFEYLSLNDF